MNKIRVGVVGVGQGKSHGVLFSQLIPETEIVAEMNKIIKEQFDGNLLPPAALVLLAKKYGAPFEDQLDSLRQSVRKGR